VGRHRKDDVQRIGPMIWTRFLKRYFRCTDLAPLNAQLLFPVVPCEEFVYKENPWPLPESVAPKIFDRSHDIGRSPDGRYVPEIYDPKTKFNLYARVSERVPESKYWLLQELSHYFQVDPPAIDTTTQVVRDILQDLQMVALESDAVLAWYCIDKGSLAKATTTTFDALCSGVLPEALALVHGLFHLSVWQEPTSNFFSLPSRLRGACEIARRNFVSNLRLASICSDDELPSELEEALKLGVEGIWLSGERSKDNDCKPLQLRSHLVLAPDTLGIHQAVAILIKAASPYTVVRPFGGWSSRNSPRPSKLPTYEEPTWPTARIKRPKRALEAEAAAAAAELELGATAVAAQLEERAQRILRGYQGKVGRGNRPPSAEHAAAVSAKK